MKSFLIQLAQGHQLTLCWIARQHQACAVPQTLIKRMRGLHKASGKRFGSLLIYGVVEGYQSLQRRVCGYASRQTYIVVRRIEGKKTRVAAGGFDIRVNRPPVTIWTQCVDPLAVVIDGVPHA